jgi:hypothetical protein
MSTVIAYSILTQFPIPVTFSSHPDMNWHLAMKETGNNYLQ